MVEAGSSSVQVDLPPLTLAVMRHHKFIDKIPMTALKETEVSSSPDRS